MSAAICRAVLAIDDGDVMPVGGEVPRGGDADNAAAEDENAHQAGAATRGGVGASSAPTGMQLQNRLRSPYTLSMRATAGQNLCSRVHGAGKAACSRE